MQSFCDNLVWSTVENLGDDHENHIRTLSKFFLIDSGRPAHECILCSVNGILYKWFRAQRS